MANLLTETIDIIESVGKTTADVRWVGSDDGAYSITWEQFAALANRKYNDCGGLQEVASDLVVVGDDWWLSRWEYDGSEGWTFNTLPLRKSDAALFINVFADNVGAVGWNKIGEIQEKHG